MVMLTIILQFQFYDRSTKDNKNTFVSARQNFIASAIMAQTSKNPTLTARSTFPLSLFANNWPFAPFKSSSNVWQLYQNLWPASSWTNFDWLGVWPPLLDNIWQLLATTRVFFFICARKSRVAGERWKVPGQTAGRPSPGDVCPPRPAPPPTPPRTCAIDEWHCHSSWSALTGFACEVEASFLGDISEAK